MSRIKVDKHLPLPPRRSRSLSLSHTHTRFSPSTHIHKPLPNIWFGSRCRRLCRSTDGAAAKSKYFRRPLENQPAIQHHVRPPQGVKRLTPCPPIYGSQACYTVSSHNSARSPCDDTGGVGTPVSFSPPTRAKAPCSQLHRLVRARVHRHHAVSCIV